MKKISTLLRSALLTCLIVASSSSVLPMWPFGGAASFEVETWEKNKEAQKLEGLLKKENYPQLFASLNVLLKNPDLAENALDWIDKQIDEGYVPLQDFFIDHFIQCSQESEGLIELCYVNRVFTIMLRALIMTDLLCYWTVHNKWLNLTEAIQDVRKALCCKYYSFIEKAFSLYKPSYKSFLSVEIDFITDFINKEAVHKPAWFHNYTNKVTSVVFGQPSYAQWLHIWDAHDEQFIKKILTKGFVNKITDRYLAVQSWEELFSVDV